MISHPSEKPLRGNGDISSGGRRHRFVYRSGAREGLLGFGTVECIQEARSEMHPDRCSGKNEAKEKFQTIHEAYSVLSDLDKRLMYDIGVYNENDDDENAGMEDFLGELAEMMQWLPDAMLREKLRKIMASDHYTDTPEMKAPDDVAAAVGKYNNAC